VNTERGDRPRPSPPGWRRCDLRARDEGDGKPKARFTVNLKNAAGVVGTTTRTDTIGW
jgi:hypothetical protein